MTQDIHPISPGEVADRFNGFITDADLPDFIAGLAGARKVNAAAEVAEVTRARAGRPTPEDEYDAMHREDLYRRQFAETVGRGPASWELAGPPAAGCHPCARLGSGCADHGRKPGDPIPLPPHPWPSEGGPDIPYNLLRSVG